MVGFQVLGSNREGAMFQGIGWTLVLAGDLHSWLIRKVTPLTEELSRTEFEGLIKTKAILRGKPVGPTLLGAELLRCVLIVICV